MKRKLLNYLRCPSCANQIALASVAVEEDTEIIQGQLACEGCKKVFPIIRGVPRFAAAEQLEPDKAATAENFGWQWQHFTHEDSLYADQFLGWIAPVRPEFFKGKIVLEGDPMTPEEEEVAGVSSCARKKTYFELDRATEAMVSVPEMPKIQHNAKSEASK